MNVGTLLTQLIVGLAMIVASLFMGGCSALPVSTQTPVVNVSCSWTLYEGALAEDNDCLVEGPTSGGQLESTGNDITAPVEADVSASVTP